MKKTFILLAAALMVVACENPVIPEIQDEKPTKRVKFEINANGWEVTRALEADGVSMTDLWMFDYADGELVKTLHKVSTDADFSEPVLTMDYGEHHVYFVASRGKNPTIDGTTISWENTSDTFWKDVAITVSSAATSSVSVAMDRVSTRLRVMVNDEVPEGLTRLVITPALWYYGIDYTTGAAVEEQADAARSINIPASYVGTSGQLVVSIFGISDADEWTTDVSVEAFDGDGNNAGVVALADVPFMRNRTTVASGNLFAAGSTFSLFLNDEWLNDYTIEW